MRHYLRIRIRRRFVRAGGIRRGVLTRRVGKRLGKKKKKHGKSTEKRRRVGGYYYYYYCAFSDGHPDDSARQTGEFSHTTPETIARKR